MRAYIGCERATDWRLERVRHMAVCVASHRTPCARSYLPNNELLLSFWTYVALVAIRVSLSPIGVLLFPKSGVPAIHFGHSCFP